MADEGEKFCQNCCCYGWEQPLPSARSDMKHCGQCKVFDYCEEDCQREHWLKVHKKHCEYLAGKKVLAMSEHDEVTCLVCRIGADPTNPKDRVLPCTMATTTMAQMRVVVDTVSPGLGLAEMTGKFHSKEEATVTQMMRLVIKMSEHPATSTRTRELCGKLYKVLDGARGKCWSAQYGYSDNVIAQSGVVATNLISAIINIDRLVVDLNQDGAIWSMLAILSYFLEAETSSSGRKIVENTNMLPDMSDIVARVRLTSCRLKELWDSLLRMFEGGLVPHFPEVMAVMCGGVIHKCCVCDEVVTVARVWRTKDPAPVPVLLLLHAAGPMHVVMCAKQGCWVRLGRIKHEAFQLRKLYIEVKVAHSMENCDYCGQNYGGRVGHRCSKCLTKLYCGEECRDQDWGVHRLNCKEGKEDRKKKGGKGVRMQDGAALVNEVREVLRRSFNEQ